MVMKKMILGAVLGGLLGVGGSYLLKCTGST